MTNTTNTPESKLSSLLTPPSSLSPGDSSLLTPPSPKPAVAVCGWELSHNAAGRVWTLAQMYATFADVEIIGAHFPAWGRQVWGPMRGGDIPVHGMVVENPAEFVAQALELVAAHPCEVLHLSKPRMPNIIFGLLYKLIWKATVLMDIDDEELAFVQAQTPLTLEAWLKQHGTLPPLEGISKQEWTRLAVGLAQAFDGVTVSNPALQQRYGGDILRHARDEACFQPSPERKQQSRATFNLPQDKKVVLFFGTPRAHKGLVETAQALANLTREDTVFVIAGAFPDAALKAELQAIKGVTYHFLGDQPVASIPEVVAAGDICVLLHNPAAAATPYQVPAKLSDALGMGLTVLLQEGPAVVDVIDSGAVIGVRDLKALPEMLQAALSQACPQDASPYHDRAWNLFLREFSFAANVPRLHQTLKTARTSASPLTPLLPLVQHLEALAPVRPLIEFGPDKAPATADHQPKSGPGISINHRSDQSPKSKTSKITNTTNTPDPKLSPLSPGDSSSSSLLTPHSSLPKGVSIIILTHNAAPLLERLLASFIQVNTLRPVELLVVDHASGDNTREVIRQFSTRAFIRILRRDGNYSFAESCNYAAARARYPYLLFLNNDIVYTEDVLGRAVEVLKKNRDIDSTEVYITSKPITMFRKYSFKPENAKQGAESKSISTKFSVADNLDYKWNALSYQSITTSQEITIPENFYIFPATMAQKNTMRYRVLHLEELCKGITNVKILNYRDVDAQFFENLRSNRDVVLIQRISFRGSDEEKFLNALRATPAQVAYDIDDQIFDINELEEWRYSSLPNHPKTYLKAMRYADFFTTSTKSLRNKIESFFKKPTYILQNVLNQKQIINSREASHNFCKPNMFTIGYASGSNTHDNDLACALPGIAIFLREHSNAHFYCIGELALPDNFLREFGKQIIISKSVSWVDLPQVLAKFSVQIIPLEDNTFNHYKSHIRYLESSAVKVPVLGSNCGEQSLTIIDEHTGKLCTNTAESWYEGLRWYYDDPVRSKQVAETAHEHVCNYWSTSSQIRRNKVKQFLGDMTLGIMRDKISIILIVYNSLHDVKAIFNSIKENTNVPYELLVWVNIDSPEIRSFIRALTDENIYIVDLQKNFGKAKAANHLFKIALERFIVGLDDDYILPHYWAEKAITATKSIPKVGWVSSNLTPDSSGIRGLGKLASYPGGTCIYLPSGVGGWMVFTTASAREEIGFYREHGFYGGIDGDYNRRARSMGFTTGYIRNLVGQHKTQRDSSLAWELFKQRIQDNMRIHGKDSDLVTDKFTDFFKERSQYLTCSIKISTPVTHDENVWGDTHFAMGLKEELEKIDYGVRIDKHENWYSHKEKSDVVIHLFGLHKYEPDPYSLNIIWVISHPEKVSRVQLLKYDYIFCASEKLLNYVRKLVPEIKSELLYQCTDTRVFFPDENVTKDIEVLFVGNSRRVYRNCIKYAVESNIDVHIWGTKWEQFIPKKYIKGQSIASNRVAELYRRSKIILNDHWDDQLEYGLVNNRIFDGFACGSIVISDYNVGVNHIFGDGVIPMFNSKAEFKKYILELLADPDRRKILSEDIGYSVRSNHTFKNRVVIIHNAIKYLISNYVDYKSEKLYQVRHKAHDVQKAAD